MPTPEIQSRLATGAIPTPPGIAAALLAAIDGSAPRLSDAISLASLDPGTTVRAFAAVAGRRVVDVRIAARMLGEQRLVRLVAGTTVLTDENEASLVLQLVRRGAVSALGVRAFAESTRLPLPPNIHAAAVLQDIGELAMLRTFGRRYAIVRANTGADHALLASAEQAEFGCTHADAGAAWLEQLGIDADTRAIVAAHERTAAPPTDLAEAVHALALGRLMGECIAAAEPAAPRRRISERATLWFGRGADSSADRALVQLRPLAKRFEETLMCWSVGNAEMLTSRLAALGTRLDAAGDARSAA
jgi:HD-like signal output (HDOD) protein